MSHIILKLNISFYLNGAIKYSLILEINFHRGFVKRKHDPTGVFHIDNILLKEE